MNNHFFATWFTGNSPARPEKSALFEDALPVLVQKKIFPFMQTAQSTPGLFNNRIRS